MSGRWPLLAEFVQVDVLAHDEVARAEQGCKGGARYVSHPAIGVDDKELGGSWVVAVGCYHALAAM